MAEPIPPGLADQRDAGPSSPRSLKTATPPTLTKALDVEMNGVGVKEATAASSTVSDEAAQLLLNVSATGFIDHADKTLATGDPTAPEDKPVVIAASYLHTPPEDPVPIIDRPLAEPVSNGPTSTDSTRKPPSTGAGEPSVHFAPTSSGPEQAMSPAQSLAGSTSTTKSRNKRKRNAVAGPSRPPISPAVNGDKPEHYMGEDNTVIRCICGSTDDDGFTIQCELCGAWEHGYCFGYFDEESAPEKFFCELCDPRPVDRESARRLQGMDVGDDPLVDGFDTVKVRTKGKRPKGDTGPKDEGKDPSPITSKAPQPKPRRRPMKPPKPTKPSHTEPAPSTVFKEPDLPTIPPGGIPGQELEDPYFRVEPWTLEYTPVRANVVRGKAARQAMRKLWVDWVDDDQEDIPRHGRNRPLENGHGLPSPTDTGATRYSPEAILPPPDYSILAPPVPPVSLIGADLASLGAPMTIKAVRDVPSFLPISYNEISTSTGVYRSPTLYAVYTKEKVQAGSFIGEYRGEVIDSASYRRDPINQYSGLGIPKPFVRAMGPPVDLLIDTRGYGTELRFIRSSCHPNAVLRPIVWRPSESEPPRLRFGIFASIDIPRRQEITLAWEWDDNHIVHALQSIVQTGISDDGSITPPDLLVPGQTVRTMAQKFDAVLTTLYGTFSSCACTVPGNCAIAQMKFIIDFSATLEDRHRRQSASGSRSSKVDLGELVGAVRGWRRRELEVEGVKLANRANGSASVSRRTSASRQSGSESVEPEWYGNKADETEDESARMDLDQEQEDEDGQDEEEQETEAVTPAPQPEDDDDEAESVVQDSSMDIDPPSATVPSTLPTISETSPLKATPAIPPLSETFTHSDTQAMVNGPAAQRDIFGTSASALSSAPSPPSFRAHLRAQVDARKPDLSASVSSHESAEIDTGNESDATTATDPRSSFSDSGEDSEGDLTPATKTAPLPAESEPAHAIEVNAKEDKPQVTRAVPDLFNDRSPPPTIPKTEAGDSTTPDDTMEFDESEIVVEQVSGSQLISPPRRSTKSQTPTNKSGNRTKAATKGKENKGVKVKGTAGQKRSRLSEGRARRTASPEKRATASDQVAGPMAEPSEVVVPMDEQQEITKEPEQLEPMKEPSPSPPPPPREPTPPPRRVPMAEYLKLAKRKKEGVVPPTESPAGEVGPVVPLTTVVPAASVEPGPTSTAAPLAPAPIAKLEPMENGGIPGFRHMSPARKSEALPSVPPVNGAMDLDGSISPAAVKADADKDKDNRFKFTDYLPSHGSTIVQTPAIETPSVTPGLGLTRGEYFPHQPQPPASAQTNVSSSYVPRKSSSYVPRHQGSVSQAPSESPSIDDYLPKSSSSAQAPLPPSSYLPRPSPASEYQPLPPSMSMSQSQSSSSSSYQPRVSPYRPPSALPEPTIPPPAIREAPPHAPGLAAARAPPTGPKVPPKGPRTSGGSAGTPFVPARDRDWDARDRDRERERDRDRDRDRDWDRERERERERDRDREPVSPRATFGVGSARGGAPKPVPFHRGRGGGRGGFRGRGGWGQ